MPWLWKSFPESGSSFLSDTAHKKGKISGGLEKLSGSSQEQNKPALILAESFILTLTRRVLMSYFRQQREALSSS